MEALESEGASLADALLGAEADALGGELVPADGDALFDGSGELAAHADDWVVYADASTPTLPYTVTVVPTTPSTATCGAACRPEVLQSVARFKDYPPQQPGESQDAYILRVARDLAPRVYLAEGESFKPSSVEYFLKGTDMELAGGTKMDAAAAMARGGSWMAENRLVTKVDPGSLSAYARLQPVLRGEGTVAPAYVIIGEPKPCSLVHDLGWLSSTRLDYQFLDIQYWFFFPYNQGKTGLTDESDNHVGDWEHVTLRLSNLPKTTAEAPEPHLTPRALFLATHVKWDQPGSGMVARGPDDAPDVRVEHGGLLGAIAQGVQTVAAGVQRVASFLAGSGPKTVHFEEGHPVLYAARGSHDLYPDVASHAGWTGHLTGNKDETSRGAAWDVWKNVKIIQERDVRAAREGKLPASSLDPDFRWIPFKGRWGNPAADCRPLFKYCRRSDGPLGPVDTVDTLYSKYVESLKQEERVCEPTDRSFWETLNPATWFAARCRTERRLRDPSGALASAICSRMY